MVDAGKTYPLSSGGRNSWPSFPEPSSTKPWTSPSALGWIPSSRTRWCAAPSRCRTAAARWSACWSSPKPGAAADAARGRRRRACRVRGPDQEVPGRLDRFRRRRGDAGGHGRSAQAGQGARPARPDAESEDRHRDRGHRQGGARKSRPAESSSRSTRPATCMCRSARLAFAAEQIVENARAVIEAVVAGPAGQRQGHLCAQLHLVQHHESAGPAGCARLLREPNLTSTNHAR